MHTTTQTPERERYLLDHPTMTDILRDLRIPKTDPGAGDHAPSFDLPTTDGGRITSESIRREGKPVLLVFGSLTCPVTESAAGGLNDLHARYGDRVRFVMVNVREAHPGSTTGQPRDAEQKRANAIALRAHHRFAFEVAVDDIEGTLHRAFGPRPSSAYLLDPSGEILFRAHWSNTTDAIGNALESIVSGTRPARTDVHQTLRAMSAMTGHADAAFEAAGRGAMLDTWKAAPPFAAMIVMSRMFSFLPRGRRGAPTILAMVVLVVAAVWLFLAAAA